MLRLDANEVEDIISSCFEGALRKAWYVAEDMGDSFEERRTAFLWILQKFLESGRFRLANRKTQQPLEGSVEDLVKLFDFAMPKTGEEVDASLLADLTKYPDVASEAGTGVLMWCWFDDEACPGDALWWMEVSPGVWEWGCF